MVQDLENQGYEFEAAEASFDILVKKALGVYRPKFERIAYRVESVSSPLPTGGEGPGVRVERFHARWVFAAYLNNQSIAHATPSPPAPLPRWGEGGNTA